jgi:hypothetical protein
VDDPVEQTDHRISCGPMRPATGSTGSSGSELRRNPRLTTSISRGGLHSSGALADRLTSIRFPVRLDCRCNAAGHSGGLGWSVGTGAARAG